MQMRGACVPLSIHQTLADAESAEREVLRFRGPLLDNDDRHDREQALARLAAANKVLAAYSPRLVLTSKRGAA